MKVKELLVVSEVERSMTRQEMHEKRKPPSGFVVVTMVMVMGVSLFAGYMLAKDIPSRLVRRLTLIAVMALTIYAGGEGARGLYALSAFNGQDTVASEPCLDDRLHVVNAEIEVARVPGNFIRRMSLKIDRVEPLPQRVFRAFGNRVQPQLANCFGASRVDAVVEATLAGASGDTRLGRVKQVLEQLRLPCVPHPRARAANVGDG